VESVKNEINGVNARYRKLSMVELDDKAKEDNHVSIRVLEDNPS
jgi:hypothetical protein